MLNRTGPRTESCLSTACAPESFCCLPQGPDRPQATCSHVVGTHLEEEEWALVRGLYYARKLPGICPDLSPGEAANFSVDGTWSADGAPVP